MIRFFPASCLALAALALSAPTLAGCDDPVVSIDGHTGVPLARLAMSGSTISEVTLLGPDTVHVVHGDKPGIVVAGDPRAAAALRFVLTDGKLGIGRKPDADAGNGTAIVTITDPSVDHLIMAGSGAIASDRLDGPNVGVTIGGSGQVGVNAIAAGKLDVEVLGSGSFAGSGHADKLELTLAGSGSADLARLRAGEANIDLAGTGSGSLSSDGKVTGTVVGTGTVTVHGKAHCDVSVTGPGKVTCRV
jgi:hypothetical protein